MVWGYALLCLLVAVASHDYLLLEDSAPINYKYAEDLGYTSSLVTSCTIRFWMQWSIKPTSDALVLSSSNFDSTQSLAEEFRVDLSSSLTLKFSRQSKLIQVAAADSLFTWNYVAISISTSATTICNGRWGVTGLVCQTANLGATSVSRASLVMRGGASSYHGEMYDLAVSPMKSRAQLQADFTSVACHSICRSSCFGPSHTACSAFFSLVDHTTPLYLSDLESLIIDRTDSAFHGSSFASVQDLAVTGWVYALSIDSQVSWCNVVWLKNSE